MLAQVIGLVGYSFLLHALLYACSSRSNREYSTVSMRTRTSFAANSSARVKQEATSSTRDSTPHCWLWQDGFVQLPIANHIDGKLAFAVKAFEAQLKLNNIQSPQHKHAGLKELARKLRLEVRPGGDAWGQLGLLQGVATTVRECNPTSQQVHIEPLKTSCNCLGGATFG